MNTPLASFFTKIGFEVDKTSLNALESQLGNLQSKIEGMAKSLKGISNSAALKSQMQLAKVEAQLEKAKQATLKEEYKLAQKKAVTETIYAKANAATMVQKMKINAAADMAAIKESLDAGNKLRYSNQKREDLERDLILRKRRNEENDAIAKRRLVDDQSKVTKAQSIAQSRIQVIQANTARLAQQAITKATPYAPRVGGRGGGSPPEGGGGGMSVFGGGAMLAGLYAAKEAITKVARFSFDVGNFQTSQPAQYEFLTGSAKGAQDQIKYVDNLVDKLKLNLQDTNQAYVQFLGATGSTIGVEKTQKIFENLQSFGVMMGATGDNLNRGTKAVQQMLSKQKLSAEELNNQLAEASLIPG